MQNPSFHLIVGTAHVSLGGKTERPYSSEIGRKTERPQSHEIGMCLQTAARDLNLMLDVTVWKPDEEHPWISKHGRRGFRV